MKSRDARVGMRVRIRRSRDENALLGKRGTIVARWGHPDHAALDVLLDEGTSRLLWFYEVEALPSRREQRASRRRPETGRAAR